jgi:transposase
MTSDVLGVSKDTNIICKKMADRRKEMSTPQKQMVVSLREDGFSQYKIAEILGVSQSCISRFLCKFNQSGSIENLPRSGRP